MTTWAWALLAWLAVAVPAGILVGRAIRHGGHGGTVPDGYAQGRADAQLTHKPEEDQP